MDGPNMNSLYKLFQNNNFNNNNDINNSNMNYPNLNYPQMSNNIKYILFIYISIEQMMKFYQMMNSMNDNNGNNFNRINNNANPNQLSFSQLNGLLNPPQQVVQQPQINSNELLKNLLIQLQQKQQENGTNKNSLFFPVQYPSPAKTNLRREITKYLILVI